MKVSNLEECEARCHGHLDCKGFNLEGSDCKCYSKVTFWTSKSGTVAYVDRNQPIKGRKRTFSFCSKCNSFCFLECMAPFQLVDNLGCFHAHYDVNRLTYSKGRQVCESYGGALFEFTKNINLEMQPFFDYLFASGGKNI